MSRPKLPRVVSVSVTQGHLVLNSSRVAVRFNARMKFHAGLAEAQSFDTRKRRGHTLELVALDMPESTLTGERTLARCVEGGIRESFYGRVGRRPMYPSATPLSEVLLDHDEEAVDA